MKSYLKSKTMWLNLAVGLIGVITAIVADAPLDAQTSGFVLSGLGAVNMFLRSITTEAIGAGG